MTVRFCFDDEQLRFQESVRGMLGRECSPERLRALSTSDTGRSPELWTKLAEIGLPEDGLERAARIAAESPYPNPRPVEYAPVLELLGNAWAGRRP